MKLAMIGSYGHCNYVLDSPVVPETVEVVAVARYGGDDELGYHGRHAAVPAGTPVYDDYVRMLDEAAPDVVGVFLPLYRNAAASMAAARRGVHVFSEKPLATTLQDLDELRGAVEKAGVKVTAAFGMRATGPYQAVREVVQGGAIGEPILASAQKSYPFGRRDKYYKSRGTYGGTIPWTAIHALEYVSYCTGKDYARVAAMHSNESLIEYPGTEDNGGILLELVGGGHAVICFDYLRPKAEGSQRRHGDDRLRIAGSEGIVEIADEGTRVRLMTLTDVEDVSCPPDRDLFEEFIDSIQGRGDGLVTTAESFRITEVALKAREAADTGKIIDL